MKHNETKIEQLTEEQMLFNTVYTHLVRQGGPAGRFDADDFFVCEYRDARGQRCAVGFLIPDDVYGPELENQPVEMLIRTAMRGELEARQNEFFKSLEPHASLLMDMQAAHDQFRRMVDDGKFKGAWTEWLQTRFASIAKNHNLDASILEEVV